MHVESGAESDASRPDPFSLVPIPDLIHSSAATLARLIRAREVTSGEVVAAHLERIAAVNPALNAVVQLDADAALADARAADADLARGVVSGPLHGVPFTVEDWIDVGGVICTGADPRYRDRKAREDATAVARLRGAGGVFLGKTNAVTGNEIYGRTNNPHDLARSPSGSSSGEAAIVAAGGSPLGLGSDSGGSIRTPAHACGVAGLKPTMGRVPLTGHFPAINPLSDPRTVIGPLARRVEDLALALSVIGGPDGRDASAVPVPLGDWRAVELAALRVAFYTSHAEADPSPMCRQAAEDAALALAEVVASVEEALPPRIEETYALTRAYWRRPESASWDEWEGPTESPLSGMEIAQHLFAWDRFRRALLGFMQRFDVIVTPAMELPAQPHGAPEGGIAYTLAYSLTGYPAVVLRVGTADGGLPIGVQIVACPWRDDVALAVAAWLEQRFGGWQMPVTPSA